jgi:hypothetical protein
MPDYAAQLTPADRWAVVAYIKALQLSQNAKTSDVPAGEQVKTLGEIADKEGLPADFASDWASKLPATAIYGTPNNQDNGIPAPPQTTAPAAKAAGPTQ